LSLRSSRSWKTAARSSLREKSKSGGVRNKKI
jgi:hypothetical protein